MNKYTVCRYLATVPASFPYIMSTITVLLQYMRLSETCGAIWECLKPADISARDKNDWIRTANEFNERTNFPNCTGVDGKHIWIRKPNNSGSQFIFYKYFFSTFLMTVADAVCCSYQ
jgi:hypothetical protein